MENLSFSGRAMHFGNPSDLHIKGGRAQGLIQPLVTFGAGYGTGGTGGAVDIRNFNLDTTSPPLIVNLNGPRSTPDGSTITLDNACCPTGNPGQPTISGIPTANVLSYGANGFIPNSPSVSVQGSQFRGNGGLGTSGAAFITASGTSVVGHGISTPTAPTVVVGGSGSCVSNCVTAGTYFYVISAQDIYGNESGLSPATSGTTDGTQTITVSWTPIAGQVQTRRWRGASANNVNSTDTPGFGVSGTSYSDSGSTFYSNTTQQFGAMSASAGSLGLAGQQLTITGGGSKEVMTSIPRGAFSGLAPTLVSGVTPARIMSMVPDKALTVTAISYTIPPGGLVGSGCTQAPNVRVSDGTTLGTLFPLTNGSGGASLIGQSTNFAAGADLRLELAFSAAGCTQNWSNVNFVVEFRPQ